LFFHIFLLHGIHKSIIPLSDPDGIFHKKTVIKPVLVYRSRLPGIRSFANNNLLVCRVEIHIIRITRCKKNP
jgi:hypothetical protein